MNHPEPPLPVAAYGFGPFLLKANERVLVDDGRQVRLGARAMDILIALVQGAGRVVSRAELCEFAWPDGDVASATLNVHVAALRQALRDGHDGRRFVVNVSGRGYQFVAPVTNHASDADTGVVALADGPANPLQGRLTRLVGREATLEHLAKRLVTQRLVTLTGPAGIGKTSIALAVAVASRTSFEDGVALVEFARISDASLVPSALAQALGLPVHQGDPLPDLRNALAGRQMLLILDNCEHVVAAAAEVVQAVLTAADRVTILTTSREPLRVQGEQVLLVPALDYPDTTAPLDAAQALTFPAVELFEQRVRSAMPEFRLTDQDAACAADICRHMDGVPLGIELAASHVEAFGVQGLSGHLDGPLGLAVTGLRSAPTRHRTMYAAVDWSYRILGPDEQAVLRSISVFAGGFLLDAALSVAGGEQLTTDEVADLLAILASKSLLTVHVDDDVRYSLLESTRSFGMQALDDCGESHAVRRRHAAHYRERLQRARHLSAASEVVAALAPELDNVRAALAWSFSSDGDPELARALTAASAPLWFALNLLSECNAWMVRAQAIPPSASESADASAAIRYGAQSSAIFTRGANEDAFSSWMRAKEESVEVAADADSFLHLLAPWTVLLRKMELEKAAELVAEAERVAERIGDRDAAATASWMRSLTSHHQGHLVDALESFQRFLRQESTAGRQFFLGISGFDRRSGVYLLRGLTKWLMGHTDEGLFDSQIGYREALAVGTDLPVCEALQWRGFTLYLAGVEATELEQTATELTSRAQASDMSSHAALGTALLGLSYSLRRDWAKAKGLLEDGIRSVQASRYGPFDPLLIGEFAAASAADGDPEGGLAAISSFEASLEEELSWCMPEFLRRKADVLQALGRYAESEQSLRRSIELARGQGAFAWETRSSRTLVELLEHVGGKRIESAPPGELAR